MTTTSGGGTLSLIHGNARAIPLADQSVHLIVTSPPYFALRSYRDDAPDNNHGKGARWRYRDGGLRAKALGVDRPERQVPGQLSLLDGVS